MQNDANIKRSLALLVDELVLKLGESGAILTLIQLVLDRYEPLKGIASVQETSIDPARAEPCEVGSNWLGRYPSQTLEVPTLLRQRQQAQLVGTVVQRFKGRGGTIPTEEFALIIGTREEAGKLSVVLDRELGNRTTYSVSQKVVKAVGRLVEQESAG